MQKQDEDIDPKEKQNPEEAEENTEPDEGVYLFNDDGTPMDTEERTYISVDDLPGEEEEEDSEKE